jgi:hypothetical protein
MRFALRASRGKGRAYLVVRWMWEVRIPIPRWLYWRLQRSRHKWFYYEVKS